MAKYNSSAFGNISGEVLGVVASSNKGVNFIKNKAKITDAKTEKQLARRAIYENFCKLWDEKIIGGTVTDYRAMYIGDNVFKNALKIALKYSQNASLLWLTICPINGTMSAPIFTKKEFELSANGAIKLTGYFLFPAFDNSGDFELFSGFFGQNIYGYDQSKISLDVYVQGEITAREMQISARAPNTTQNAPSGQKVFRSYWYANKKTGQVSKPLGLAIDESGNVETFYPFGK